MTRGDDGRVELRVRVGAGRSGAAIATLRKMFPQLRDRSVAALTRELGAQGWISLGGVARSEARGVVDEARDAGIVVEVVEE